MQDTDFEWFKENYSDIFSKFGNSFVAVKNNTVIGSFSTFAEAYEKTCEKEVPGTFIVQLCNGDETGYSNYVTSMNFMNC